MSDTAAVSTVGVAIRRSVCKAAWVHAADSSIRGVLVDLFTDSPVPRQSARLVDELTDAGLDLGADPERRLRAAIETDVGFTDAVDGHVFLPALFEGTRWTVAVDSDGAESDFVHHDDDLAALNWLLIADEVALVDRAGVEIGELVADTADIDGVLVDVLAGPPAWLQQLAGGSASVQVIDGGLGWFPCEREPSVTTRQVNAIRAAYELTAQTESYGVFMSEDPVELSFALFDDVILEALVIDRNAFVGDQAPRLESLFGAAELERDGPLVAAAGFDWGQVTTWQERNRNMREFALDDEEAEFLSMLVGASDLVMAGGPEALGPDEQQRVAGAAVLASILEQHTDVALAFWVSQSVHVAPEKILMFADELLDALDEVTPGVAWLRSRSLDDAARVQDAIAALDEVVSGTDHSLLLIDAAAFAADRGDAPGADRLLQRAGAYEHLNSHDGEFTHSSPDLDLLAEILPFIKRVKPTAGRNDPCPCGSGRKYKACHLGKEQYPLDVRAGWLYDKAVRYLRRVDRFAMEEIAREMAVHVDRETQQQLADSPAVADFALHEGGLFGEFLAARSDLLPDDEALLASQWSLVDRGVFEVEQAGPGWLELLNIGRGERITVTGLGSDSMPAPGELLLGRPVPVGDSYRAFSGFLRVPRTAIDALVDAIDEGDSLEIAAVFGATLAPPRLSNTGGEQMAIHELRWRMDGDGPIDVEAVDALLCGQGLTRNEGDEPPTWNLVRDTTNQPRSIIATLRLDDGVLVAEVNSDERAEEIGMLIDETIPDAVFLGDESRSIDEMMRDHDPSSVPPTAPDLDDPAIREALVKMMRGHEDRWVDESIPALGGRTPREAVQDPVGREEVIQLLATFPDLDEMGGIGMDPDRLRSMLGL